MAAKLQKSPFRNVIAGIGGCTAVAMAMAQPLSRVKMWRSRDSIPSGYWNAIIALANRSGMKAISLRAFADYAAEKVARGKVRGRRNVTAVDNGGNVHGDANRIGD